MSLKEHTVKSYDKDIKSIAGTIDDMMHLVLESIDMVSEMITRRDSDLIEKISKHDYKINSLDHLIEKKITAILALRQPMAVDLRYIISALKVSSNLERIGDQAKKYNEKIIDVGVEEFKVDVKKSLFEMIDLSKDMIKNSVSAFNDQDFDLAKKVLEQDDRIDEIYKNLFGIIDDENFSKDQVKKITNTLFVAKSFERLADHSTNVAEIAQFVITGEIH